jgi:hypothetical protein
MARAAKEAQAAELEKTIEVDGRTMKKRDMVEFEIEKRLGSGQSQADIMKALSGQNLKVDPNYVKERLAVARRRNPPLKVDPNHRKMEANWIVEKGLTTGKSWDEISQELVTSGFNGPKITETAKGKQAEMLNNGSSPAAVIDDGSTGPNAGPDDPNGGAYTGPVQDLKDLRKATDQEVLDTLKKAGDEAHRRREDKFKAMREKGSHYNDGFDWSQIDEYYKSRVTPKSSKLTENDTAVPLDQAPLKPPSEYANPQDSGTDTAEPRTLGQEQQ